LSSRAVDFLVLGAQKCATSALTVYLGEHPGLAVPQQTAGFFDSDRYHRGPRWLGNAFFRGVENGALRGTVTPMYMIGTPHPGRGDRAARP